MHSQTENRSTKVLFLSAWYPTRMDPMFGLFVKKHALAASKDHQVLVLHVCADPSLKHSSEITRQQQGALMEIIIYYRSKPQGLFKGLHNLWAWIRAYATGLRLMKKEWGRPHITHVNILTRTGLVAWYLKIFRKIPYVITEHWSRYLDKNGVFKGFFRVMLTRMVIRAASQLTVVSHHLGKAMIRKKVCKSYEILPNVVETGLFQMAQQRKAGKTLKTIVHISCFEEQSKNMSGILQAVKILSQQRQDFLLRMVGTGMDWENTVARASEMGLHGRFVQFDGLQEGQNLAHILAQADFSILFSFYETFGIVVYESLACGVPVLVSKVADFDQHITAQRGKIISGYCPQDMATAMNYMLDVCHTFDAQALREFAESQFGEQKIRTLLHNMYIKALHTQTHAHCKS